MGEDTRPSLIRRLAAAVLATAAVAVAVPIAAGAGTQPPATPPPATGHAQVIAQRVVDIGDGDHHWAIAGGMLDPQGPAVAADRSLFAVATGGIVLLHRHHAGEAEVVGLTARPGPGDLPGVPR